MAKEYPVAGKEDMETILRSRGVSDRSERLVQAGYGNTAGGAFRVLSWRANCEAVGLGFDPWEAHFWTFRSIFMSAMMANTTSK